MKKAANISVEATVKSDITKVWNTWVEPEHIKKWNFASPDWHTPKAENDLREGGKFSATMEAKDGSSGFDFTGTYNEIVPHQKIKYTIDDGRKVKITFKQLSNGILVREVFEPETVNSQDRQQQGWQAILDNFKAYVESN